MSKPRHLRLVSSPATSDPSSAHPDLPDPPTDAMLRGGLYDAVLAGLRAFAQENPEITLDKAASLLNEFPVFLVGLKSTLRGYGLLRELPRVPGYEAHPRG